MTSDCCMCKNIYRINENKKKKKKYQKERRKIKWELKKYY